MFQGRLSKKLVLYIILFSGVFTLITTSYTVYHDYQNRVSSFEQKVIDMVDSYEDVLGVAIYNLQFETIGMISSAFRGLSKEYAVAIKDSQGRDIVLSNSNYETFNRKNAPETRDEFFVYLKPIYFNLINEDAFLRYMGTIEVIAHKGQIKSDVIANIKTIVIAQFIKSLIVSLFILFLIDRLILSRQNKIVSWLGEFTKNRNVEALQERDTPSSDELDDMANAINKMGREIVSHQKTLESSVIDRTRELVVKNSELENAQKQLHLLLHSKSSALTHIEETLSTWLWEIDVFGNITSMSESLNDSQDNTDNKQTVVRLTDLVALPKSHNDVLIDKALKDILESREPFTIHDAEMKNSTGETIAIRIDGRPKIVNDAYTGFSGTITDISSEKKLHKLAYSDGLTGLANRLALQNYFETTQQRASRLDFSIGIMELDLDFFKSINDDYGHAVGDDVLKAVALTLSDCVRDEDCVARIGGEEFVIAVQGATSEGLIALAKRINESISSLRLSSIPVERQITVSIGLTIAAPNELLVDALKRADSFLYLSKENGRNTFTGDT